MQQKPELFDDLVGAAKQRKRECDAECLRGPEVEHELDFDPHRPKSTGFSPLRIRPV